MTEETIPQPVVDEPVVAPQTETEAPVETTEKVETQPETATPEEPAKAEEKPKSRAQQRVEEALSRAKAAESTAAELKAELARLRAFQEPRPEAYDDPARYQADLMKHAVKEARADEIAGQVERTEQGSREAVRSAWSAKVEGAAERFPDFKEVFNDRLPVTEAMAELLVESDNGAAVAYWLGKNPQEAARIAALPPHRQGAEMGRIEARITLPPPKKISAAPPPAPVVSGGGAPASQIPPSDLPMDEFASWLLKKVG